MADLAPHLRLSDRVAFPPELPICARVVEIVNAIDAHQVVIVAGETGSGKTTQLPKICLAMGRGARGQIGCTQPRRIAATSVAAMRRGWVTPMCASRPRPMARQILGSWVVLPEPVSPATMTTGWVSIAAAMSRTRAEIGSSSGKRMGLGTAPWH